MLACVFVLGVMLPTSAAHQLNLNLLGLQDNGSNESEYHRLDTKYKKERVLFKTLLNLWNDPELLALHNCFRQLSHICSQKSNRIKACSQFNQNDERNFFFKCLNKTFFLFHCYGIHNSFQKVDYFQNLLFNGSTI